METNLPPCFEVTRQYIDPDEVIELEKMLGQIEDWNSGEYAHRYTRGFRWYHTEGVDFDHNWKTKWPHWKSHAYPKWLSDLHHRVQTEFGEVGSTINSVLINRYAPDDFIPPHRDSKHLFGETPTIVSLSFGDTRVFEVIDSHTGEKYSVSLNPGDLLIMRGESQKNYLHSVGKGDYVRYNLTFRDFKTV